MADENQITLFTDFDTAMVKQNSAIRLLSWLVIRHPTKAIPSIMSAFRRYGMTGTGFIYAIAFCDDYTRRVAAEAVANRLTFNPKWLDSLILMIRRYSLIKSIKIVVITRNIYLIPGIFMENNSQILYKLTEGKFRGNVEIIANDIEAVVRSNLTVPKQNRYYRLKDLLRNVINLSRNKRIFIKSKNAFYFGDQEEYMELVRYTGLKQLHFIKV